MRYSGWLLLIFVLVSIGSVASEVIVARDVDIKRELTVVRMQATVEAVGVYFDSEGEQAARDALRSRRLFERVGAMSRKLPDGFRDSLHERDAWGHPLYISCALSECMLISLGEDGESDLADGILSLSTDGDVAANEAALKEAIAHNLEQIEAGRLDTDDLIYVDGETIDGLTARKARARRTMADLRSLGTAVETYSIDNNVYPAVNSIEALVAQVEPIYIRTAPVTDAWGNPFLYLGDAGSYMIVSFGADGRPDTGYSWPMNEEQLAARGALSSLDQDLVFIDGQFVAWFE